MRPSLMFSGLVVLGGALVAVPWTGCRSCTDIGCGDTLEATVQGSDGTLPNGTHRIEILADGASITCSFVFPTAMPSTTSFTNCSTGARVAVGPEYVCADTTGVGGRLVHQCDPIPGRFIEQIGIFGAPGQVHIWQYVDDVPILDAAVAPTYMNNSPNGPECGPTCRLASVSWTLQ